MAEDRDRAAERTTLPQDVLDRESVIPSTRALRAFVVAAQYRSFSRAADELGVTQGGVSRAIKGIEALTGRRLFERGARGLALTHAGAAYFGEVRRLLAELGAATLQFSGHDQASQSLNVATLPSFGSLWLAPRLAGFIAGNPAVALVVSTNIGVVDFARSDVDCVIHYGSDAWPEGARSELLMDESLVPYCSPRLLPPRRTPGAETLLSLPLIQHTHRPTAWREWFKAVGIAHPGPTAGCRFEQYQMGIRAAVGGLGAALMPPMLVSREVAGGELVALHPRPVPSTWKYHFVYPETKRNLLSLRRFRAWILAEARESARQHP